MIFIIGMILALVVWTIYATLRYLGEPSKFKDFDDKVMLLGFPGIFFTIGGWASLAIAIIVAVTIHIHHKMKEVKDEQQ